jgi:hypothetical protein
MVTEEVFVNCYNFNPGLLLKSKKVIFQVTLKLSRTRPGAGAANPNCSSVKPEPKEIFSAQHTGERDDENESELSSLTEEG